MALVLRLFLVLLVALAPPAWAASTVDVVQVPASLAGGRAQYLITITETGDRDTSEVTLSPVPQCGTIVAIRSSLTAGTGTTIHPRIGRSASFTADSADEMLEATQTAATINEVGSAPYCLSAGGSLYLRAAPNSSATDHAITTRIVIVAGAQQ